MVSDTLVKSLRAFARRQPFKPFLVELVNGESILIEHPEALAFNGGAAVYISPKREFAFFDHEGVAELRDVSQC